MSSIHDLCIHRLVAAVLDSEVGVDGSLAFQRASAFDLSIHDAIRHLDATGHTCSIKSQVDLQPHIEEVGDTVLFHIASADVKDFDARFINRKRGSESFRLIHHFDPCHGLTVSVKDIQMPAPCPDDVDWTWVFEGDDYSLRFSVLSTPGTSSVHFFIAGVHQRTETMKGECGKLLYIDAIHSSKEHSIPQFPECTENVVEFSRCFFNVVDMHVWQESDTVTKLLSAAIPWASAIKEHWFMHDPQEWIDTLHSAKDNVLAFVNVQTILDMASVKQNVAYLGLAILRRMQTNGCTSLLDHKAGVINEFAVDKFKILPVSRSVWTRLYDLGLLQSYCNVSAYGIILGYDTHRTVCVPFDADSAAITMAIASLLNVSLSHVTEQQKDEYFFEWGSSNEELLTTCDPDELLLAYRIRHESDGIHLISDTSFTPMVASMAVPIDSLTPGQVRLDPRRTRRVNLEKIFPLLCDRLKLQGSNVDACLHEIQCRRLQKKWSLEDFDSGGNMSSMGLSNLFATILGGWMGAQVRVLVGKGGCASVAFWDGKEDNPWTLVDVSCSVKNSFDMAPYVSKIHEASEEEEIKKGFLVEVRCKQMWSVAQVLDINKNSNMATVKLLCNERVTTINLDSRTFRKLSRTSNSDVERVMKKLLLHKNKTCGSSFQVEELDE